MHFHQQGNEQAGSKWAGRASATIAVALVTVLVGCASFRMGGRDQAYGMSASQTRGAEDWLATADADKVVNAMSAKGLMPATIDCRFADTTPGQVAYLSKFTWMRAPANTRYHWEVGDPTYLASKEVRANRVGLKRVDAKLVRDAATGQKVGCSVWVG